MYTGFRGLSMHPLLRPHLVIPLILCSQLTLACDPEQQTHSRDRGTDRLEREIILVGRSEEDPTWPVLQSCADRFESLYPPTTVRVIAPRMASPRQQRELLEGLAKAKVDAVCVAPIDPASIRSVVNRLAKSGKPVVTIGQDVPNSDRAAYCGPAESATGQAAALACDQSLKGRSRTVMLLHAGEEHGSYRVRYAAFREELHLFSSIHLLKEVNCKGEAVAAVNGVRRESRMYPRVGCWVFLDDWPLRTIRPDDRLLPLGCAMIVCNGSPKHFPRMRRGEIQVLVTFDFQNAVEDALRTAARLLEERGLETIQNLFSPSMIIDIDDLDWYERCWQNWRRGETTPQRVQKKISPIPSGASRSAGRSTPG